MLPKIAAYFAYSTVRDKILLYNCAVYFLCRLAVQFDVLIHLAADNFLTYLFYAGCFVRKAREDFTDIIKTEMPGQLLIFI